MSLLDDAVAAFLAPSSGHSDPLTAATLDQCTQPAALDAPRLREGWEHEPIAVPIPWRFYAVCMACGFFLFLLVGCGHQATASTLPQPLPKHLPTPQVPASAQAACPPAAPPHPTRTDADATGLHAAHVHALHSRCAMAAAAYMPDRADLATACAEPPSPHAGPTAAAQAQAAYAACRAAIWRTPPTPQPGGMVWPLSTQQAQP